MRIKKIEDGKIQSKDTMLGSILNSRILSIRDRNHLGILVVLQVVSGFIDLVGIGLVGILGTLAVSGVQSKSPTGNVAEALRFLGITNLNFQSQTAVVGVLAVLALLVRTVISVVLTRKSLLFLSRRSAKLSIQTFRKLYTIDIPSIQRRSHEEIVFALTYGVNAIFIGLYSSLVSIIADSALLLVIGIGLFVVDPLVALTSLGIFGGLAFLIHLKLSGESRNLGEKYTSLTVSSSQSIKNSLNNYRQSIVGNRREYWINLISDQRNQLAQVQAQTSFMPNVSKYVMESAVVIGAFVISSLQFLMKDASHAVGLLAIFMAAGARVAPALMRIQNALLQINGNRGIAQTALDLVAELQDKSNDSIGMLKEENNNKEFSPVISASNVSYTYPYSNVPALSDINLSLKSNQVVSIVGPSGSGKSTLVDILLGVLQPDTGDVTLSGVDPISAHSIWPGAVSYVPQTVDIIKGTLRENLTLGYPAGIFSDYLLVEALENASLHELVKDGIENLDTEIGENGSNLSGGQKQRLGIARALVSKPKLLVLDEATSSLDGGTEALVTDSINALKGETTILMIAHRLVTVRNSDVVIYINQGRIEAFGTFDEVRAQIPDFDTQARLMGL